MRKLAGRVAFTMATAVILAVPAAADITGSIDATITLSAGCIINGQNLDDGSAVADFGTLDFGTQNTLFSQADGEVLGGGGAALSVQCSPGVAPVLVLGAGQNDGLGAGAGLHAMAHTTSAGQYVTYNLYSDAGRSSVIAVNDTIPLLATGAAQTVNIYGRAFGEAGLESGTYDDVITVTLEL